MPSLVGDLGQVHGVLCWAITRVCNLFVGAALLCVHEMSTVVVCSTDLWVVYWQKGLAMYASTREWAPPTDKLSILKHALILVHSIVANTYEPSLTLRVALNKSWPRLIWNTLVVSLVPRPGYEANWWLEPYLQWLCRCVHWVNFGLRAVKEDWELFFPCPLLIKNCHKIIHSCK